MKKQNDVYVSLSSSTQKILIKDISQRHSIEACGVLLGSIDTQGNWLIEEALPLHNIFESPVYFEFAPEDLLEVELLHPGKVVGVYHSHPTGFAGASSTDRENMRRVNQEQQIPWVWLIIRGPFNEHFIYTAQEHIPQEAVKAYHHFVGQGLQEITIQFEDVSRTSSASYDAS